MRPAEAVIATFFTAFVIFAWVVEDPGNRRLESVGLGVFGLALVAAGPLVDGSPWGRLVRDLLPSLLLLLTYWQTGRLVTAIDPRFQQLLVRVERRWFSPVVSLSERIQDRRGWFLYLSASYLACYPILPLGVVVLHLVGRADAVPTFWLVVLPPTLACHALTTVFRSWPPWVSDQTDGARPERSVVESLNRWVSDHASIRANTFPSGHAASTAAVALALWHVGPLWGVAFGWLAGSVAVATVLLRYHYTTDTLLGLGLAVASYLTLG